MAAFTSKATGNWNSGGQTTWNEVGVPGAGDSVTINSNHVITIPVGSPVTLGADTAADYLTLSASASLICNDNLTVSGTGIILHGTGALFQLAPVSSIVTLTLAAGTNAPSFRISFTGAGTSQIKFTGNTTYRAKVVGTNSGTAQGNISFNGSNVLMDWRYCTISNLGNGGDAVIAKNVFWRNVLFDGNLGAVRIISNDNVANADVSGLDFRNLSGNPFFVYQNLTTITTDTRSFSNITAYDLGTTNPFLRLNFACNDTTIDTIHLVGCALQMDQTGGKRNIVRNFISARSNYPEANHASFVFGNAALLMEKCAFLNYGANADTNVYNVRETNNSYTDGDNTYRYQFIDGWGRAEQSDSILPGGPCNISYSLGINKMGNLADGLGVGSVQSVENCTLYNYSSNPLSGGVVISESQPSALKGKNVRNNIFHTGAAGVTDGATSSFIQQTNFVMDYNCAWNMTSTSGLFYHPNGQKGYLFRGKLTRTLSSSTCTAGTNTTTVVVSAGNFTTSSVQAGDVVYNSTRGIYALVSSVDSTTQLTLGARLDVASSTGITGQTTGDSIIIYQAMWSTGKYGDDGKGLHDIYTDPNFVDTTRNAKTWDISLGGPNTGNALDNINNISAEILKLNGIDKNSAAANYNTNYSWLNLWNYMKAGFTPQNSALRGTGVSSLDIGAFPVVVPSPVSAGIGLQLGIQI